MAIAKGTKDDCAIRNVSNPLHFVRSRSCGDLSTFDPAFDDVMRRGLEKNSYAKRFKPLIRQLALLSFARNLLLCTAVAVQFRGLMGVRTGDERENQEPDNQLQKKSDGLLSPLAYVLFVQGATLACSLIDLFYAFLLWNGVRKMRGPSFLSAANLRDITRISIGCYESDVLKKYLEEHVAYTVQTTAGLLLVVGIIQFHYPKFFWYLWLYVVYIFWNHSTLDTAGQALLLATLPCIGLAVVSLNIARKCRPLILQFRQIIWKEMLVDVAFDVWDGSNLIGWLYRNWPVIRYRVRHIVRDRRSFWSVMWMLSLVFGGDKKSSVIMTKN
ncbi:uncharacterized protein LOC129590849 [Paramacrobiotus metropolitanus]|uniref:uncharacterized protein LOC129590849 n=1 Tax=Paramacrobiotus metropolitanus TaxID=2943436 RepID=UPI0024456B54|nr:uncharacterized protein LOC129590849 [Paramacrobiotus metropolitanus]